MHKDSESIAHHEERTLVVALGASNLSRGMSRLLQASRFCSSSAVDLVVAAGHGSSGIIYKRKYPMAGKIKAPECDRYFLLITSSCY